MFKNALTWLKGRSPRVGRVRLSSYFSSSAKLHNVAAIEEIAELTDFCVIGGGPAGLSFAIRLKQLSKQHDKDLRIMLIEKGSSIGAHNLSGAVIEPRALDELLPGWRDMNSPVRTKVSSNKMVYLTKKRSIPLVHPPSLNNNNNYITSISALCSWLGEIAEGLGVEIYPGFAASEIIYDGNTVKGIKTNDFGIAKDGTHKENYEKGLNILAKSTIFAEGCRGNLTELIKEKYSLTEDSHQSYGIGLKEVWEIKKENYIDGLVLHSVGWPGNSKYYGGGFMYHFDNNKCSVGFVVGLDYVNPTISPYDEFQLFKTHSSISKYLLGGNPLNYGAKALNEGGYQGVPKLVFPGGALIGCSAGFLDVIKIKGIHTAMKSGIICADVAFSEFQKYHHSSTLDLSLYQKKLHNSWIMNDLYTSRNIRPSFSKFGLLGGLLYSGIDNVLFKGYVPWTFKFSKKDHERLKPLNFVNPINYPKYDKKLTFSILDNLSRSGTNHEDNQPCHLKLKRGHDHQLNTSLHIYGGPEQYYCPAGVYEYVDDDTSLLKKRLQINSQNCIHCKTCDIKDPTQNIKWTTPQGGGGPKWDCT